MPDPVTLRLGALAGLDMVMWWPLVGTADARARDRRAGRYRFELVARDVEELNKLAVRESRSREPGRPRPGSSADAPLDDPGRHRDLARGVRADRGPVGDHRVRRVVRRGVRAADRGARTPLRAPDDLRGSESRSSASTLRLLAMGVMLD
ncbi:MAG: hypothetical protein R3B49_01665 [Phycisphaerales bacterium]